MQTSCDIEFENNPSKVFHSGQTIRGTVRLTHAETQPWSEIFVRIKGEGYVKWDEGSGSNRKTYRGFKSYIEEIVHITGGQTGEGTLSSHVESWYIILLYCNDSIEKCRYNYCVSWRFSPSL